MASRYKYFYLIELQFLGFRYHGWQKQLEVKTIQGVLERTFDFIFEEEKYRILGAGRTDATVSAESSFFELFTTHPKEVEELKEELNNNLPADVAVKSVKEVDNQFNIIQDVKLKTYHYYFASTTEKFPFATPFINCIDKALDIDKMKQAATLFEGEHEFKYFMQGDADQKKTLRSIQESRIEANTYLTANFFPEESYVFVVKGKGFMRYQIRLMMGALLNIGTDNLTLEELKLALKGEFPEFKKFSAAASALRVKEVEFNF